MSEEMTLTRRAGSTRKRHAVNIAKTSKRNRTESRDVDDKGSENVLCEEKQLTLKEKRLTRSATKRVKQCWLQNSFAPMEYEHVSSTPIKTQKSKHDSGYMSFAGPRSPDVTLISESQNLFECGNTISGTQTPRHASPVLTTGEGYGGDIFSTLPATAQNLVPHTQRLAGSPNATQSNEMLEEPYCTQHRSFNDSDSLFADMDFPDLTEEPENSCKKRLSARKTRSATKCPRTNSNSQVCSKALQPVKLTFGSNSQDMNAGVNIVTGKTPHNIKGLQNSKASKQTVKQEGFDSDDAILADIDLNQVLVEERDLFSTECDSVSNWTSSVNPEAKATTCEQSYIKSNARTAAHKKDITTNSNEELSVIKPLANKPCDVAKQSISTPRGVSVVERLRRSMLENAKAATTPLGSAHKLRAERIHEAEREAAALHAQASEFDIGPFYGLPSKVQALFESVRGISKLYDWQHECLSLEALRNNRNLIYSLPTSGGKTLVAEVLILRELLCKKRDAVLVLPFVAIVQEKVRGLSQFAVELDFLVEEYAGSKGCFPPKRRRNRKSLFVCTIEKANSLVNSLIEADRIKELGLVVVDELHMLGEGGSRGAVLEMTLTKLMHMAEQTQIIGMSATLNNIKDLQDFLAAEIYSNDFRPVKLTEYVKVEDNIYEVDSKALCPDDRLQHRRCLTFPYDREMLKVDPDFLAGLVEEVIPNHSCLLFCPTKKNCENVAELLCKMLPKDMKNQRISEKKALLSALREDGSGAVCPVLSRTIPYGLAYHHSGLTADERRLVEEAYGEGTLCLLCCTSTLAAGVNLPAKRVILRSPYVGAEFLTRSQYKQMVGRAGRAGIDSSGESILILQKKDKLKMLELVSGPCDHCTSSLLYEQGKGMRGMLLTAVGLKIATTRSSVVDLVRKTLCHVQAGTLNVDIVSVATRALQSLIELKLVHYRKLSGAGEGVEEREGEMGRENGELLVTDLGRAVFKGSVDIDRGPQLYRDLVRASDSLCVANHLHLLYLATPYDMVEGIKPDWMRYLNEISTFDASEMRVANLIGVTESYIARKVSGHFSRKVDDYSVRRFYLTLMLHGLWRQQSVWLVASKFGQSRGFVQQLLANAAAFASCVARFCEELEEFWAYQDLLSKFVQRLSYCVTMELIPLMEIPGVKQGRARQLYGAGYKTLQEVGHADPESLVREIKHMPRKVARQIVASAKMLLQEKAESLRDEAAEIEQAPLRMPTAHDIERDMDGSQASRWSDSQLSGTEAFLPTTLPP